jgi:anti-sigma-K factor RskA
MIDDETEELASLYSLGLLSEEEASAFAERLRHEPELQALGDDLDEVIANLAHLAPLEEPAPEVRLKLLAAVRGQAALLPGARSATGGGGVYWLPWAIAAALAVLAGWLALERAQTRREIAGWRERETVAQQRITSLQTDAGAVEQREAAAKEELAALKIRDEVSQHELAALRDQNGAAQKELAALRDQNAAAQKEIAGLRDQDALSKLRIATLSAQGRNVPGSLGSVAWDGSKQRGVVTLEKLPPPGPAQDYQLWVIDPQYKQPVSGGLVHVDEHGNARLIFTVDMPIHEADKFAVSRERKGGSATALGPIVLLGE